MILVYVVVFTCSNTAPLTSFGYFWISLQYLRRRFTFIVDLLAVCCLFLAAYYDIVGTLHRTSLVVIIF